MEAQTGEIVALQLKREKVLEHFADRSSCLIGMEACGGSQHWARSLQKLGHEVKLLSGRMVKPSVSGNKSHAADARRIWTAVQQPGIKGFLCALVANSLFLSRCLIRFRAGH